MQCNVYLPCVLRKNMCAVRKLVCAVHGGLHKSVRAASALGNLCACGVFEPAVCAAVFKGRCEQRF